MRVSKLLDKENNNFDLIRLLCAYFVIYSHSFAISPSPGQMDILTKLTGDGFIAISGVAVKTFFLISGMLVSNSLFEKNDVKTYVSSRFFRIYPAYFFVIIISTLLLGPLLTSLSLTDYFSSKETWEYTLKNIILFTTHYLPGVFNSNQLSAINGALWTIPVEISAYVSILFIYLILSPVKKYREIVISIIALCIFIEPLTPFKGSLIARSSNPSIYELCPFFALGCFLSIFKEKITTFHILIFSLFFCMTYFFSSSVEWKTMSVYISLSMLLIYLSSTKLVLALKLKRDISYGVYLVAFPVQQILTMYIHTSPYANFLLGLIISSFIAYLISIFIESPAMKLNKKICSSLKMEKINC